MLPKSASFHNFCRTALLFGALAACGGGESGGAEDAASANVPQAGPPMEIRPLTDAELLGLDRAHVILNLPWSDNVLVREPAPASARGTLQSVTLQRGPDFDRFTLTFGADAPLPGYRVVWNELRTAGCAGSTPAELPAAQTLLVATEPATAREGPAVNTRSVRGDLGTLESASRICDDLGRLVWALPARDSSAVRTIELRDPPRIVVDVQHRAATP